MFLNYECNATGEQGGKETLFVRESPHFMRKKPLFARRFETTLRTMKTICLGHRQNDLRETVSLETHGFALAKHGRSIGEIEMSRQTPPRAGDQI